MATTNIAAFKIISSSGPMRARSFSARAGYARFGGPRRQRQVWGVRVIYYWLKADHQIFLLTIYGKSEKADLTADELKRVVKLIEELT